MNKEVKALIKDLESRGFYVTRDGNHYKLRNEKGNYMLSLPVTPGRGRWRQNLEAVMKRKGLL